MRTNAAHAVLWILVGACSGTQTTETEVPSTDPHAALHAINQEARAGGVVETLHGVEVRDPYRSLETESDLTTRWVEQQTSATRAALPVTDEARARMRTLLGIGSLGSVVGAGERVFFQRREGDREQPLYLVRVGDAEHVLIDPTLHGERAALDWAYPSETGRYVAFGISLNGDERSTLHVLDVDAKLALLEGPATHTGEAARDAGLLPLRIPRTKWCNLSWLHDDTGFYYTRYPKPDEPGFDAEHEDNYFPRVFFHALAPSAQPAQARSAQARPAQAAQTAPPTGDDPLVWGSETGTDFPVPNVSTDDGHLVLNVFRGWSASDVYLYDRSHGPAPSEAHPVRTIVQGEDNVTNGFVHGGKFYAHTNRDAPRYRLVSVPLARAHEPARWRDVIPQRDAPLEQIALVGTRHLVGHYIDDIRSKIVVFDRSGRELGEAELPARGALEGGFSASTSRTTVQFAFSGYLLAPTLLQLDAADRAVETLAAVEADFDFSPYVTELHRVESADGTMVPVTLIHRADQPRDRRGRVILYGYGGFNISLLPSLRRNALYWLERGGVYAVANLRGGGEMGEDWHRAGMLDQKEHVFEDFEAILEWLSTSGISSRHRIGITGGSNGGLLMGAMITRVPERFVAAASYVGLYDMVRYHQFPPAELWVSEYGSAEDATQFQTLHAYSPYHRVEAGTPYPAILVETADHDSRVHWAHSTKFVASLQEATSSGRPVHFFMERAMGHGAGTRLSDQAEKYARMFAFFDRFLAEGRRAGAAEAAPADEAAEAAPADEAAEAAPADEAAEAAEAETEVAPADDAAAAGEDAPAD